MKPSDADSNLMPKATGLRLEVRGLGHIISFKNHKRSILDNKTGLQRTLTAPHAKEQMERIIQLFVSQLLCATQTTGFVTTPGHTKLSAIVSLLPFDDSRQWIPETVITTQIVPKGEEGATITIERLT